MYRAGALPRTNCRAGNANIYSHSQLKALILKTGKCMDQAWGPILNRQGIDWSPPGYAIAAKRGRGACGDYPSAGNMVPYYCPRNNTIYASTSAMARGNGNSIGYGQISSWHGAIISMMAHEYGHHVQNITGILGSHWQKHLGSSSKSGRLALSRKLELQATCFGGMFMRAVASSYPVTSSGRGTLYAFYARVGDFPGYPRDHGSPANNNRWFRQGWEKNKAFQCNTWLAPASTTS
ncbi:neutral zinc metallopeptidase [Nonomuraea sp. NPDC046570]|uniref:neutral zinc metallopeptidase n=1 Tax=Nonomuraea sp. NPDC046570 TaxID=3155255 RepID=UPI0033F002F2